MAAVGVSQRGAVPRTAVQLGSYPGAAPLATATTNRISLQTLRRGGEVAGMTIHRDFISSGYRRWLTIAVWQLGPATATRAESSSCSFSKLDLRV